MIELLTASEVAALIHRKPAWVRQRCRTGVWQYVRIGQTYLFTPEDVAANLDLQRVTPTPPPAASWGRSTRRKA